MLLVAFTRIPYSFIRKTLIFLIKIEIITIYLYKVIPCINNIVVYIKNVLWTKYGKYIP